MRSFRFLSVILSLSLLGCGVPANLTASASAVEQFHTQLDHEDFVGIYQQADPRFRQASKQEDVVALFNAIHKKLGTVKSSTRTSFHVNFNTSGNNIVALYSTAFIGGDAQEEFTWATSGAKPLLIATTSIPLP